MKVLFLIIFLVPEVLICNGYKILISFPGVAGSQDLIMTRLGELLSSHGHEVTILNPTVIKTKFPKVPDAIRVLQFPAQAEPGDLEFFSERMNSLNWESNAPGTPPWKFPRLLRAYSSYCNTTIHRENLISELKSQNFDVIIIHLFDICGFGVAHLLNIKSTIWMSTAFALDYIHYFSGAPMPLAYVPSGVTALSNNMTLIERSKNVFSFVLVNAVFKKVVVPHFNKIFRQKYGPEFPELTPLMEQTQLYFVYADQLFDFPRPTSPNTIHIGGFVMENPEKLGKEWEDLLTSERAVKHGVILFSLGTVAKTETMPKKILMAFLNAFKKLDQLVIWKLDGDFPEAKEVPNVLISKWLPQKDLLVHKSIRLFITHGGYNSITEATFTGIPLIVCPLFGDQFSNSKRVERAGIGVSLDKPDFTNEVKIHTAILEVLNNPSYATSARRLAALIARQPTSSREQAVKWVEFLAEFRTLPELQIQVHHLGPIKYFLLDVIAILGLGFALGLCLCCCSAKICCRMLCRGSKQKSE